MLAFAYLYQRRRAASRGGMAHNGQRKGGVNISYLKTTGRASCKGVVTRRRRRYGGYQALRRREERMAAQAWQAWRAVGEREAA
jgi:hypothetical protein